MIKINVVMDFLIGGAYVGMLRIADKLPQYNWTFTTEVEADATIVLYMNNHRHYERAKTLGMRYIIQRKTGERSLKTQAPQDLDAVICASKRSWEKTIHDKKALIYNGIDFDHLNTIMPKPGIDLLICESRLGVGQRVDVSIQYAIKHGKHLTILGSGEGLAEDTYNKLYKKYPQCSWIGRISPEEALMYIKGCEALLVANPSHGCANQIIEGLAMDKQIIDLTPNKSLEIPAKCDIDIRKTAAEYEKLISTILGDNK